MQEWSLIIFTLLIQASVGITLLTTFTLIYTNKRLNNEEQYRYALPAMLVAFAAGTLGLIVSTAHLGYPLNAFHALRHVGSSWLSREIIFASLYLGLLGLATLIALFKKRIWIVLLLIASLLGIVDIFCMSAIYAHSSVVTWMHSNTYWMFYGAALGLGAIACLWSFVIQPDLPSPLVRRVVVTVVIMVIAITLCRLVAQPLYMNYLSTLGSSHIVTFPHQPLAAFEELGRVRLASWLILIAGVSALVLCLRSHRINQGMLALGSVLLVVAEVSLRFSFFSIN
ncbi:dimethyl sulfoxide reductase anchor subunit family protein [Yersinia frederiksenii]|uniref:dimethyl sulfoxide reductase anchor subunit family protein n=1 Tax=Yersinia frederiksenii TaxID=29484 RepID=UPI0005DC2583|nr:DmsC/YnfH family molybdoenzyme membrane anchor subunit [Yersinia frederiksenii]MDN0121429.1 dimethyl sulfoxide reductase anchor subunit [Yersinia frederiksenii]CNG43472.1 anaerobic dimethyl sulfoxide reductase chain C [Yersinia frederiksenii]